MFKLRHRIHMALGIALLALMTTVPAAWAGDIKHVMSEMQQAYDGAMKSVSISEFSQYAARFQTSVNAASQMEYKADPATYRQGMQELKQEISVMNQSIKVNDLAGAKAALLRIKSTKKHYHDALN